MLRCSGCECAWVAWLVCTRLLLLVVAQDSQTCPPPANCPFRILCIGDSLTKGDVPSKQLVHPYSLKLQQLVNKKFKDRATPTVTAVAYDYMGVFQKGHNDAGDVIDVTLVPLLQSQLAAAKQKGSNYHWVVIMAGINDLGAGNYTAAAIMPKLVQAYKAALQSGANVVVIAPFPNRFVAKTSPNEIERQKLIALMQAWVSGQPKTSDCGKPRVYLLQLPASLFNVWNMPAAKVAEMQDDLLHLTEAGYDILGQFVFNAISTRVPLRDCLCPNGNAPAGTQMQQGSSAGGKH